MSGAPWRLFYVQGGKELAIAGDLRERAIEAFCPFERFKRHLPRGIAWVDKPLYPSYIFARTDRFAETKLISGVVHVVSRGTRALAVPDNIISTMVGFCSPEGEVRRVDTTKNSFGFRGVAGDRFTFKKRSPLFGVIGEIVSISSLDETGQIRAFVDLFGRLTEISLHFSEVGSLVKDDVRAVA